VRSSGGKKRWNGSAIDASKVWAAYEAMSDKRKKRYSYLIIKDLNLKNANAEAIRAIIHQKKKRRSQTHS
jgi:hypothetical protein